MSDAIGLGLTHFPLLAGRDDNMAALLRGTLTDPDIPVEAKDPASWPQRMREEWSDDKGARAAAGHRRDLVRGLARCREALDEFRPDLVVVWGDDQFENFRDEVVPPFCVLAYDDVEVQPFHLLAERGWPNAWGLPEDTEYTMHSDPATARALTGDLIDAGFDMAYSYRMRQGLNFPHSILNTQTFLDYDNAGRTFPYPILGVTVNCYGQHVIARRGGLARFAEIADERLDPIGPTPARCFALGAAIAKALSPSGQRVAYVASSSWSHAFLNDKDWHLYPDTAADGLLYTALVAGDRETWLSVTPKEIVDAGQHEMLNWYCLLGAADELGLSLTWSEFVPSDAFNSNKAFAVFGDAA